MDFVEFGKIYRLSREMVVTEKIDGTNGQIYIGEDGEFLVGSRTRWVTPEADNHGFAKWAYEHKDELLTLGPGRHFGEWWGSGIQRGYDLPKGEKRFSLFNVSRWARRGETAPEDVAKAIPPSCVGVVPTLYCGEFDTNAVAGCLTDLARKGSVAAPGFMRPEGVVIFHVPSRYLFKKTIEGDGHKGLDKSAGKE